MPDGQPPDSQADGHARADAILALARAAFVDKGFDGASMQDLARAAAMSAGNLYRYFPSKAAIVEALIARDLAGVEEGFRAIVAAPDPHAALIAALHHKMSEAGCQGDDALWAEIAAAARRKPEVGRALGRLEDAITRRVAQVIGVLGGVPEAEAERRFATHAQAIFLLMHGALTGRPAEGPRDGALVPLLIRIIEGVIADALGRPKDIP